MVAAGPGQVTNPAKRATGQPYGWGRKRGGRLNPHLCWHAIPHRLRQGVVELDPSCGLWGNQIEQCPLLGPSICGTVRVAQGRFGTRFASGDSARSGRRFQMSRAIFQEPSCFRHRRK